jgi:hypothetical protein
MVKLDKAYLEEDVKNIYEVTFICEDIVVMVEIVGRLRKETDD